MEISHYGRSNHTDAVDKGSAGAEPHSWRGGAGVRRAGLVRELRTCGRTRVPTSTRPSSLLDDAGVPGGCHRP